MPTRLEWVQTRSPAYPSAASAKTSFVLTNQELQTSRSNAAAAIPCPPRTALVRHKACKTETPQARSTGDFSSVSLTSGLLVIQGSLRSIHTSRLAGAIRLRQECGLLPVLISRSRFLLSRSTSRSQLGSMCECGRRTGSWIGLTPKVHLFLRSGPIQQSNRILAVVPRG